MSKFQWINLFLRDILLALVMIWVNYTVEFRSWAAAFVMGMIVVLTSWHFSDLIKSKEGLGNGLFRHVDNMGNSSRTIHNRLQ